MMRQAISARFAISIFFILFHPYLSVMVFSDGSNSID
jgi:hypothetical protein